MQNFDRAYLILKTTFFVGVLFFLSCNNISAQVQTKIDSLLERLQDARTDEERLVITLALSKKLLSTNNFRALEYANESIELARKTKSDSLLVKAYANQGSAFMQLGNYSKALALYQQASLEAEKIRDTTTLIAINGNMGSIYYYQGNHENGLTYYKKALSFLDTANALADPRRLLQRANVLNNIGILYEEAMKYDEAMKYYQEALSLGRKVHDDEVTATVLNNIGELYADEGSNLDVALQYCLQALDLRKQNKDRVGLARSNLNLGQFYYRNKHDPKAAEPYFKEAIVLGKEIGAWETVRWASNDLYKIYKEGGLHKEAFSTLELYMQVNDSLFNEENTRKIAQLEMQYEFDRKQTIMEAEQKEMRLFYWMGASGLFLLLIIVTLLFILQRSKTRQSLLEQSHLMLEKINLKNDLAIKDKELATNIIYLLNKNELINTISEKLLDIKQNVSSDKQMMVQKLILDLQSNLQPELWQEFEFRFQQVHEQFYKTLNEKFPDLTPSERRLCAFLKLNMTTKEISALTYQNAKSIDVARTRLRKKLNLTGTDHNLVTFLAQLDKSMVQE
ncbi:MAG TPA: tetratricopeptide repeat protein [Ohtaekwangia sp.]